MNAKEMAALLNGREYTKEITRTEEAEAEAAGLVIIFGASDDLAELRGSINDEVGAYEGTEFFVDATGLIPDYEVMLADERHGHKDRLREYFKREGGGKKIEAIWDRDGYSWTYKTDIPHETFEIVEDGEKYCRGIVFALTDCA